MLTATTRVVVAVVAIFVLLGGLGLLAVGPIAGVSSLSGLWLVISAAVVLVALAIERNRYRSEEAERSFEAAEDELDDLASDLRGQQTLCWRVKRPDVQRPGMPERRAGSRGCKGLMDVADVQRQDRQQVLDGSRDVDGERGHPAA